MSSQNVITKACQLIILTSQFYCTA